MISPRIIAGIALVLVLLITGYVAFINRGQTPEEEAVTTDERPAEALVTTSEPVTYFEGITGHFAKPTAPAPEGGYPGVVMIHEWWGLNDNIKAAANRLASEGYAVLAVDLFGTVATTPEEARAQVSSLDQERALLNLRSAVTFLANQGSPKIASLGWCFGGGQSLKLSASGEPLAATVLYYGTPITNPTDLSAINNPVLGIFGEADESIPLEDIEAFRAAMNAAEKTGEIHTYPGVGHAFANPSNPDYAPEETEDAWAKTLDFLAANLKN